MKHKIGSGRAWWFVAVTLCGLALSANGADEKWDLANGGTYSVTNNGIIYYLDNWERGTSSLPSECSVYRSVDGISGSVSIPSSISVTFVNRASTNTPKDTTTKSIAVKEIRSQAFYNRTGITSVSIPSSVNTIGSSAFSGCTSLSSVSLPNSITVISNSMFNGCTSLRSVTIPSSVREIGGSAFQDTALTSVTIPSSVTTIGNEAFNGCSALTNATIGNSVTNIGERAFLGCSSLTNVVIPNSVREIGENAFYGCSSLASVVIPNSVATLGISAFGGCDSLTSVTVGSGVTSWGMFSFFLSTNIVNLTLVDGLKEIGDYAFPMTKIQTLEIPNSVTNIGYMAFFWCDSLKSVTMGSGMKTIGDYALSSCTSLTNLAIGRSVEEIGWGAFSDCTSLTNATIPDSVTWAGELVFALCSNLVDVVIGNGLTELAEGTFSNCTSLANVYLQGLPPGCGSDVFTGVPEGARGHYLPEYAAAWQAVIDSEGKWNGLIMREPTFYAVCVGIDRYALFENLKGSAQAATDMASYLCSRGQWERNNVDTFLNYGASLSRIRSAIEKASTVAQSGDTFLYYHTSHGWNDFANALVLPYGFYTKTELAQDLGKFKSGVSVVVVLDACYSGGMISDVSVSAAEVSPLSQATDDSNIDAFIADVSSLIDMHSVQAKAVGASMSISSSEIGWLTSVSATAVSYYTDAYGPDFSYHIMHGWKSGLCDMTAAGNRDGYASFYELGKYAEGKIGPYYLAPPLSPQYKNPSVLQSVNAGYTGGGGLQSPPVFANHDLQGIRIGEAMAVSIWASGAPTYSLLNATAISGFSFDSNTGVLTYTPTSVDEGIQTFTFQARNAAGSATQTVQVQVSSNPTITVSPTALSVPSAGHASLTLNVTANVNWTVRSDVSWIIVHTSSGANAGSVSYTVVENFLPVSRTGTITVSGPFGPAICSITQAGAQATSTDVPHWWLDEHNLVNNGDYEAAAIDDKDGDGYTSKQEYIAGTDPNLAASVPLILMGQDDLGLYLAVDPDLGDERVYRVEGTPTLVSPSWGDADESSQFFRMQINLPAATTP